MTKDNFWSCCACVAVLFGVGIGVMSAWLNYKGRDEKPKRLYI